MKKTLLSVLVGLICATGHAQNRESTALAQIDQSGATAAWARGITGRGVTIGIIDQGFDPTHRDYLGRVVASRNFYSAGPVTWGIHGTAMASVAAGSANGLGTRGLAPDAELIFAQAGPGGANNILSEVSVYRALEWLSTTKASIINMSFGASYDPGFVNAVTRNVQTGIYFSPRAAGVNYGAADDIINYYSRATNRGQILVAAAGNQGLPYSEFPGMYATRTNVNKELVLGGRMIVVGAVDSKNQIASFSNRAGHLCQLVSALTCLDSYRTRDFFVVAPGVSIAAAQPNQLTQGANGAYLVSGTSPAAAYVSGGMALIKQAWPQLRPEQLVNLVLSTARDLGTPGTDDVYGRGLVDFDLATKPQGTLRVANQQPISGGAGTGPVLSATAAATNAAMAKLFRSTSIVQNAQVLDQLGRNYTVDLGRAVIGYNQNYSPDSPWLGIQGFQQTRLPVTQTLSARFMVGQTGSAVEFEHDSRVIKSQLQFGNMKENGYLGNQGQGAMSFGSSDTSWVQVGIEKELVTDIALMAKYAQAITQVRNDAMSMIHTDDHVYSRSWSLGLAKYNMFNHGDRLMFSAGIPVSVTQGRARLTGVVGYEYEELSDGNYQANPIVSTETIDLRSRTQEYNLVAGYQQRFDKGQIQLNLIQKINAGGVAGQQSSYAGVMFSWIQ